MTAESSATAPATPKSGSSGCFVVLMVIVGLLLGGFIWNAVTGNDSSRVRNISRYSYPGTWPLTLDAVTIGCDGHNPWVRVGSTFYALNGAGRTAGYSDIDPIWAYEPAAAGLKMNIAPLRADAEKLC
jgi:hypothetical protein